MTFSDTAMMEFGITQSADTHNKRSLILTSHVCQRHRAAGRNQQVEGYKHTHTHTKAATFFACFSQNTAPALFTLCRNATFLTLQDLG